MIAVRGGYSKKFDLVKKARETMPETFSTRDFVYQMLQALEANYSDQIVFLDVLQAIVQKTTVKGYNIWMTDLDGEKKLLIGGIEHLRMNLRMLIKRNK